MINSGVIYRFTFPNGKYYIGQSWNYKERCKSHKSESITRGKSVVYKAIRKHGWDNIIKDILTSNLKTQEQLDLYEIFWINTYDSRNRSIGYNIAPGGKGGSGLKGINSPMFGKTRSIESKIKQGKSVKKYFEENPEVLKNRNINFKKNHNNWISPLKGIKRSPEIIEKVKAARNKTVIKILQYDLEGNFLKEWNSCTEIGTYYRIHPSNISRILTKNNRSAAGFMWKKKSKEYLLKINPYLKYK